jgi:hypothetical protein
MKTFNHSFKLLFFLAALLIFCPDFIYGQCLPPAAKVIPSHLTVIKGDSIRVTATITGTGPIDCQWYNLRTGIIKGATKPGCTFYNVVKADTVYLRVINGCGQQFSNPVYLELDLVTPSTQQVTTKPKPKPTVAPKPKPKPTAVRAKQVQ